MKLHRLTTPLLASLVVGTGANVARADLLSVDPGTARGDGVYGRFDGDVDLGVGLGARIGAPGLGPNLRLSGHFLSTAGLVLDVTLPLVGADEWSLGAAIDLRPLFLPRWALDLQQGPAFTDLLLDSVSVSAGPVFHPLTEPEVGLGLEAGLAIPLTGHAAGLWLDLRGSGRWVGDAAPWGGLAALSWHGFWLSPILD